MAFSGSNRRLSGSEYLLLRVRESAGISQEELVRRLRDHCDKCAMEYATLNPRTVRRRENWSPEILGGSIDSRQDPEASRPPSTYLVHVGMACRSPEELTDELLGWAGYVPEVVRENMRRRGKGTNGSESVPTQAQRRLDLTEESQSPDNSGPMDSRDGTYSISAAEGGPSESGLDDASADAATEMARRKEPQSAFLRWRKRIIYWVTDWPYSDEPGETFPFGVALLLLQSSLLLGGFVTGLDPLGLQRWLPNLTGSITLNLLAFGIFVFTSLIAMVLFYLLRSRECGARHVFSRAIWQVFPPLVLAYVPLLVFASIGVAIFSLGVFAVLGGMFTTIVAFRDAEFLLPPWKIRSLINLVLALVVVTAVTYIAVTSIVYLVPNPVFGAGESLILGSWMIDFGSLGYPESELFQRNRFGVLLSQIAAGMCLAVVAAYLLRTVYVLEPENSQ